MRIRWPDPSAPRGPQTPYEEWLARGLLHLSQVCDGANARDGEGFNANDTDAGHYYAGMLREEGGLHSEGWDWCRAMLPKYRRQIGEAPR